MKPFLPIVKILATVGAGIAATKANQRFGVVIDQDVLIAALMAAFLAVNVRNKPERPPRQSPPQS